jgi:hypothetical protein
MSPGLPNAASAISNIGHIMNYGDGWYGGVFVGACTHLPLLQKISTTLLMKSWPFRQSEFTSIKDVIYWSKNILTTGSKLGSVREHWANDVGCPDGVFMPFNIDAKVNAAYVVIGLLYGGGDLQGLWKSQRVAVRRRLQPVYCRRNSWRGYGLR